MSSVVKIIGIYNGDDVYYIKNKVGEALVYKSKYYSFPKFIKQPDKIGILSAVKIINNRLEYLAKKEMDMKKDAVASELKIET